MGGVGPVTKSGAGTVVLNASSSCSGGSVIDEGTLAVGADNALGTGLLTLSGGDLYQVTGSGTRTLPNPIDLASGATLDIGGTDVLTLTGPVTNSGALSKLATGRSA